MRFADHVLLEQVNPSTNTDKFYEIWVVEQAPAEGLHNFVALFHWGRRGTAGQWQAQFFKEGISYAQQAANAKRRSKEKGGYTTLDGVPTTGVLGENIRQHVFEGATVPLKPVTVYVSPQTVQVDLSDFLSELLESKAVTPDHVLKRTALMEQMEELRNLMLEAEGALEVTDTIYRSRLG